MGCAQPRLADLPPVDECYVAVLSGEMPGMSHDLARYSWIVARTPNADQRMVYRKYFWLGAAEAHETTNPFSYMGTSGDGEVAVHGVLTGSREKMAEIVACLEKETAAYHDFNCGCWPGPNANTFVDGLIRACGLGIELPATALGRDYRGPIGVSTTEGRTGVQLETWLGGVKIGLKEGISADLVGLPLGVHFWPLGLEFPLNPGFAGVETSKHYPADPNRAPSFYWAPDDTITHRYGVAEIAMSASYAHMLRPSRAGDLSDRSIVGLAARGVYGKRIGYGVGLDFDIGVGFPLGFAYDAHLYPAGVGVVIGDMGFFGLFSGVGTWGVTSRVGPALELPQEARLEIDVKRAVRFGLYGGVIVVPSADDRNLLEGFGGLKLRPVTSASGRDSFGGATGGVFFSADGRQIMGTVSVGGSIGYELGLGG